MNSPCFRFNYTGSRARTKFIPELKRRKPLDLVVTGGEARDHTALFESFAGSAILLNHAGNHDNLEEAAAQHGIPVADVTSALLSREPDFYSSRDPGTHGVPRVKHPPAEVLRAQAKLILTLAVNQLCPSRPPA